MYFRCECGTEYSLRFSIRGWPKNHCPECGKEGPTDPDGEVVMLAFGIVGVLLALTGVANP